MSTEQEDAKRREGDDTGSPHGHSVPDGRTASRQTAPDSDAGEGDAGSDDTLVLPQDYVEINAKAEERDRFLDELRRSRADLDNLQKRTRRERLQLERKGARRVLRDLLAVVDNFERALASFGTPDAEVSRDGERQSGLEEGVRLIHQQLEQVLENQAIQQIAALGETFNPEYHEAVGQEEVEDRPTGEIVEVLQRGYLHYDAVLRPAAVKVARNVSVPDSPRGDDVSVPDSPRGDDVAEGGDSSPDVAEEAAS